MTSSSPSAPVSSRGTAYLWAGLATVALAGFALWLRLRLLGYTGFGSDQSLSLAQALAWVHGGPLPLASIKSSLGLYNFPLVEYLYALPLFFKSNLLGVVWLIALVNLAGLGLAAWATARVFGWRTAWWAALLFVVNPWAVYYGRIIWMQTFVPAFASIFFACVLLYFADRPHTRYILGGALSLSGAIQSHPTALVLVAVLVVVGLCFPRRLRLWPLLAGGALFLLSFAPYLVFEARLGFSDWQALRASVSGAADVSLAPLDLMVELLQSKRIYDTAGSAAAAWQALDLAWPVDALVAWLLGLGAAAAALGLVWPWRPRGERTWTPQRVGHLILLAGLVLPVLFFLRHSFPLQNYYFLYYYPVPFILMASLADQVYLWLRGQIGRRLAHGPALLGGAAGLLAFLPLALIAFQQARLDVLGQDLLARGAAGHQRIIDTQRAIDSARQLLGQKPECQLVVISEGNTYEDSRLSLLREFTRSAYGAYPDRVRFVRAGAGTLLPAPCAFYLSVTPDASVRAWLTANARPLPQYTLQMPEETWTFFEVTAEAMTRLQHQITESAPPVAEWDNGVQLRSYSLDGRWSGGNTVSMSAWWAVTHPLPSRLVHFGTYVLTAGNQVVTQADGPGVDSAQWQAGDIFQTTFTLSLPAGLASGDYTLAEALYFYPEVERLPLAGSTESLLRLEKFTVASPDH